MNIFREHHGDQYMPANLKNSAVTTGLEKVVFVPVPKKGYARECSNYHMVALISHASKVMLKILQARLQQYREQRTSTCTSGIQKGRRTRDQITNIHWIIEKSKRIPEKLSTSASLTMLKPLLCESQLTVEILKELGTPDHLTCLLRNLYQDKKQQLEPDMEQRTGSRLGKQYAKLCVVTSCEMPG